MSDSSYEFLHSKTKEKDMHDKETGNRIVYGPNDLFEVYKTLDLSTLGENIPKEALEKLGVNPSLVEKTENIEHQVNVPEKHTVVVEPSVNTLKLENIETDAIEESKDMASVSIEDAINAKMSAKNTNDKMVGEISLGNEKVKKENKERDNKEDDGR